MSENPESATTAIREAVSELANELKRTRLALEAMRTKLEDLIDRDTCECSLGYTSIRRDMN